VLVSGSVGEHVRRWLPRDGWKGSDRLRALLAIGTSNVRELVWLARRTEELFVQQLDLRTGLLGPKADAPHVHRFTQAAEQGPLAASTANPFGITPVLLGPDSPGAQLPLSAPGPSGPQVRMKDLVFHPSGRWVWTSADVHARLDLRDAIRGDVSATVSLPCGSSRLAAHPGGRHLAVCEDGRTLLFELRESPVRRAHAEGGEVRSFALSADGERLVTARERTLAVPDSTQHFRTPLTLHRRAPEGFTPVRQDRWYATRGNAGPVALDPKGAGLGLAVHTVHPTTGQAGILTPDGGWLPTGPLDDLRFGPDGRLWAASGQGKLLCWPGKGDAAVVSAVPPEADRAGVGFAVVRPGPTGTLAGRRDGKVEWFDRGARRLATWDVFADQEVSSLAIDAAGTEALVGGSQGDVARVALPTGQVTRPAQRPHTGAIFGLAYLGGGATLTASADHSIRLWSGDGELLLVLREGGRIVCAEASPAGELIVQVRSEWGLRIWDLAELGDGLRELGLPPGFSVPKVAPPPAAPPRGLLAELFHQRGHRELVERRLDPQVNFDWGTAPPSRHVGPDHFSARWTGWLRAPKPAGWEFQLDCDDVATLWLDGQVVFRSATFNPIATATVPLPNRPVSFRLDYEEQTGPARCRLLWRPAGSKEAFVPVPPEAFTPD
jgi:WD40 repeat protein